jgi:hypothetical protein
MKKGKAAIVKEQRGKAPIRRTKATLGREVLSWLIEGIEPSNPGWANLLWTLALVWLRPIELQHHTPKRVTGHACECGAAAGRPVAAS